MGISQKCSKNPNIYPSFNSRSLSLNAFTTLRRLFWKHRFPHCRIQIGNPLSELFFQRTYRKDVQKSARHHPGRSKLTQKHHFAIKRQSLHSFQTSIYIHISTRASHLAPQCRRSKSPKAGSSGSSSSQAGWSTAPLLSDCGGTHKPGSNPPPIRSLDSKLPNHPQYSMEQWLRQPSSAEPWRHWASRWLCEAVDGRTCTFRYYNG